MDDEDVLLDLGPQPRGKIPWVWLGAVWVAAAAAEIGGRGSWFAVMPPVSALAITVGIAQTAVIAPTRVTIRRDGQIVLHGRLISRRFPVRALISVERENADGGAYTLEWALDHRRISVRDRSGQLLRTLARLNPDVAMLDMEAVERAGRR